MEDFFYFDREALQELGRAHRDEYDSARPFPHVVIDDFLPPEVADRLLDEFPAPGTIPWELYEDRGKTKKLAAESPLVMSPYTRHVLAEFNSGSAVEFLEALTGIEGLIPDPYCVGGGLHQIERGGFLKVHADFNRHPRLRLDRRLNLLLYLNRDWDDAYGGHLELWDAATKTCVKKVLPTFNRCVVFSTTDEALHGHPDPLACPETRTRKSIALYYYSSGRPEEERSAAHTTLYEGASLSERVRRSWRGRAKQFVPPIVVDAVKKRRR